MTDERDGNRRPNRSVTEPTRPAVKTRWTRDRWEELPANPEDEENLGYRIAEWEQFETLDDTDQTMFLPTDESELKDAAFVVADNSAVVELEKHC